MENLVFFFIYGCGYLIGVLFLIGASFRRKYLPLIISLVFILPQHGCAFILANSRGFIDGSAFMPYFLIITVVLLGWYITLILKIERKYSLLYRITLMCPDVPSDIGDRAAIDITKHFQNQIRYKNVICTWDGSQLVLQGENNYDTEGQELLCDFTDAICTYTKSTFDVEPRVKSVEVLKN